MTPAFSLMGSRVRGPVLKAIIVVAALVVIWQGAFSLGFIQWKTIATPLQIAQEISDSYEVLGKHLWLTGKAVVLGFGGGVTAGLALGVILGLSENIAAWTFPPLVLTQVVPKIAIAPLILIIFGPAVVGKAVLAALIAFFPVLINTMVGIREVDEQYVELFESWRATRWQEFWHLRLPNAAPVVFEALRISYLYAVVGAVTAEFIRPGTGLGHLILTAEGQLDYPLMYASIVATGLLGLLGWMVFVGIEVTWLKGQNAKSLARGGV